MSGQKRIFPSWSPLRRPFDDHYKANPELKLWSDRIISGNYFPLLSIAIGASSTLTASNEGSFSKYLTLFGYI